VQANPTLREHIRARVENRPGIYRMIGPDEELLYVGKSVRVRTRVLSYFRANKGEKAWELIRGTQRIEWEYIPNEFYSLVQEMKLIQLRQPRFNVQHKRKPIYAFVKVTSEAAARIVPATRISEDGATYYGPFPRVKSVALTVRELGRALGLRDCPASTPVFFDDQLEIFTGGRTAHCFRADLKTCLAPCCGRPTAGAYQAAVDLARRFLEGRAERPLADLEAEMVRASGRMDFEYAGLLRDRLERLRGFRDQLLAFRGAVEDLTFIYRVPGFGGDDRIYLIRRGRVRKEMAHPKGQRSRERVARAIEQVYNEIDAGPGGLTPLDAAEILLVARWFEMNPKERKRTLKPEAWMRAKMPA
jgi:excinuclease ABC subunit C